MAALRESQIRPTSMPARPRMARTVLWWLLAPLAAGTIGFIWLLTLPAPLEIWLQTRVLQALRQHYHADVQLQHLRVTLVPSFHVTADNLVLSDGSGSDLPPLMTVKYLAADAGVFELLRTPVHIEWVKLDGLEIQVAPKRDQGANALAKPKQ